MDRDEGFQLEDLTSGMLWWAVRHQLREHQLRCALGILKGSQYRRSKNKKKEV